MQTYKPGDRVEHAHYGKGTVLGQRSKGVIIIDWDDRHNSRNALKYPVLKLIGGETFDSLRPGTVTYQKWLKETFTFERPGGIPHSQPLAFF